MNDGRAEVAYQDQQAARADPACCCLCGGWLNGQTYKDQRVHVDCFNDYWADMLKGDVFELGALSKEAIKDGAFKI